MRGRVGGAGSVGDVGGAQRSGKHEKTKVSGVRETLAGLEAAEPVALVARDALSVHVQGC